MCFFKKRKANKLLDKRSNHNEIIQASLKKIKGLKIKFEAFSDVCDGLESIYNKYSNASINGKDETIKIDKSISNLLSDIELCARKAESNNDLSEVEVLIKKIRALIAER